MGTDIASSAIYVRSHPTGQGTGHCPAGIFKNIISNVTKNEEAGHGPVRVPRGAHLYIKGLLPSI